MAKGYVVEKNGKYATAAGGLGTKAHVYKTKAEAQAAIDGNNKLKGASVGPADGLPDTNVAAAPGATGKPARSGGGPKKKAAAGQ
jgi:hypothetical protein